ncbi:SPASM domain-containing protein [Pseudomonas sp. On1]|uniref:SPASM domain-containing protein n=1 Tax=Pseudomonas sp. On1 TaxID=3083258 RepID=UPI0029AED0CB|nr:SPASM domain-containing protein [Pseudomonas sp. On1]MDX2309689.1 SPASM domain-containing protein [Pseudomonas sp. On1]
MIHQPFTLHIRMTKSCNADCSYCSSWMENASSRMSPAAFMKSIDFILNRALPQLGAAPTFLSAQYIGGEILTVPFQELKECVRYLRKACAQHGIEMQDGAQSNLIGTPEKISRLYDLFEGRLGTSVDDFSQARTVKGSADNYRLIWKEADHYLRKQRSTPGAVFVLDQSGLTSARQQTRLAAREGRMLTLRPLFQGGTPGQALQGSERTKKALLETFDDWFMRYPIIVEPFFHLTTARVASFAGSPHQMPNACAFQADCTQRSLSLEPNGDLHVCQEMADAGLSRVGNALDGVIDTGLLEALAARSWRLSADCQACPFVKECQGGCMFESIQQGNGMYGRSAHCASWKALFRRIDAGIQEHGLEEVRGWLHRIETRHHNHKLDGLFKASLASA